VATAWLKKKDGSAFTLNDFMLVEQEAETKQQSEEEMLAMLMGMVADGDGR
jgi:hypothetical protein